MTEMTSSHELARRLLQLPELPVATHAHGHTYASAGDTLSHGALKIARLHHYSGDHLVFGDMQRADLNTPNWYVAEWYSLQGE